MCESIGLVAQQDRTHAATALCNQDRSERAFADGEANFGIGGASTVPGRCHPEYLIRFPVEAAIGVVASVIDGLRHRFAAVEFPPDALSPMRRGVVLGAEAGDVLEHSVKVIHAHPSMPCQFIKGRRRLGAFDEAAQFSDLGHTLIRQRSLIRFASLARTKTCPFGVGRGEMERNIFRPGHAGRAGGAAIHPGRLHGVEKFAVCIGIASNYGGPTRVIHRRRYERLGLVGPVHLQPFSSVHDR